MTRPAIHYALLAWGLGLASNSIWAQTAPDDARQALYLRGLAASCANCHGTDGRVVADSAVPGLAGMDKGYFVTQMRAFQSGARPATVMHQISKGFSDTQVESLAGYFAAQKQ